MDPNSGKLYEVTEGEAAKRGLIPVRRKLTPYERTTAKIGRNAPCGCGSGKKFKKCCLVPRLPGSGGGEP